METYSISGSTYNNRMTRFLLLSLLLIYFRVPVSGGQSPVSDERLREIVRQYGQAEVTVMITDYSIIDNLSRNVSITSVRNSIAGITLSRLTVEWFIAQKLNYTIREKVSLKGLLTTASSVAKAFQWDSYPSYTQYDSIMRSFAVQYPSLCRLDTIGTSINGKLVLALRITDNPGGTAPKPEVFYTSTIHGDETGGYIMMLRLADYLLSNYNDNTRVRELVNNLDIWINPLANPDGTYASGDVISSPVRFNANGVDLNRNFPDPTLPDMVYEKETIEMVSFMKKHRFVLSANFHAGAELVNYPWDRWPEILHADDTWFYAISRGYADTAHVYGGPGYMSDLENGVTRGALWYVVFGGRQDYMTQYLHGREVTIELDYQNVTPASQLPLLWENNWHSLIGYLENAMYGVHGGVFDSDTHSPLPGEVFIKGHDVDSSQVYSDSLAGSFVRLIASGTWPLTFSASGYRDTTISVSVNDRERTDITVYMKKGEIPPDTTGLPEPPALYPNPASSAIKALLPEEVTGIVNVMIVNSSGQIVIYYDTECYKEVPLSIDVSRLSSGTYSAIFTNSKRKSSCRGRFIIIK
jgi:hypothetical protein